MFEIKLKFIPEIPDGRRFLRCDRKNRNHFYFEGTVPDISGCPKNRNSRKNPSIGGFLRFLGQVGTNDEDMGKIFAI